jgi:hypothetical protein
MALAGAGRARHSDHRQEFVRENACPSEKYNQRTESVLEDGERWEYQYDAMGHRKWGQSSPINIKR